MRPRTPHIVFAAGELFYNYRLATGASRCVLELARGLSSHCKVTIVGVAAAPEGTKRLSDSATMVLVDSESQHQQVLSGFVVDRQNVIIGAIDNAFMSLSEVLRALTPAAQLIYWNHLAENNYGTLAGLVKCLPHLGAVAIPTVYEASRLECQVPALRGRVTVVPNGIRCPCISDHGKRVLGELPPLVVFVGRRSEAKGYDLWLGVCMQLALRQVRAEFLTVGLPGTHPEGILLRTKARLISGGLLQEERYLSPRRLAGKIKEASLLVLPTRQDCFPVCLLEAMHLGTPAVVTENPNLREIAGDPPAFLFSQTPTAYDIATACEKLLDQPFARQELSERARERARIFGLGNAVEAMLRLVKSVQDRRAV